MGLLTCNALSRSGIEVREASLMKTPFLLGRLVFGGFFLYSGINHFMQRKTMAQYAGAKGVPAPELAVQASGAALVIGGASILLGVKPKLGTAAILGFLAGVSPVMHPFWPVEDPAQRQQEMINFTKNMALLGGALALMGVEEPWEASVPIAQPSRLQRLKKSAGRLLAA
jgi:putative oxidoreductase